MDTPYKDIKDLASEIAQGCAALKGGESSLQDLDQLVDHANELYQRLVVVRHNARMKFSGVEAPAPQRGPEPQPAPTPESKPETPKQETPAPEVKPEPKKEEEEPTLSSMFMGQGQMPAFDFTQVASEETKDTPKQETVQESKPEPKTEPKPAASKAQAEQKAQSQEDQSATLADKLGTTSSQTPGLNESMMSSGDQAGGLADILKQQPIESLRSAMGLNLRLSFVEKLFEGSNDAFDASIQTLDTQPGIAQARTELSLMAQENSWDMEDRLVQKFIELVERRYQ